MIRLGLLECEQNVPKNNVKPVLRPLCQSQKFYIYIFLLLIVLDLSWCRRGVRETTNERNPRWTLGIRSAAPFESGGFRADHWRSTAPYNRGVSWPVLSFKKDFRKQPLIQSSPAFFTVCAREHSAAAIRPSRISKTESLPSYAGRNFRYSEEAES